MAKESPYRVLFGSGDLGEGEFHNVTIVAGGSVVVEHRLPRAVHFGEMQRLHDLLEHQKPEPVVREIVAVWLRKLSEAGT